MDYLNDPVAIQRKSFDIIDNDPLFKEKTNSLSKEEGIILRRVIHTTVDFDFLKNFVFQKNAVSSGLAALKNGCNVITDVEMVRVGINQRKLDALGCGLLCYITDEDLKIKSVEEKVTRSTLAMRKAAQMPDGAILVIGNAPTALLEAIQLIKNGKMKPSLVIGVPVGFVSALESKDLLATMGDIPFITSLGPKGGSSVAVAIVNALLEILS